MKTILKITFLAVLIFTVSVFISNNLAGKSGSNVYADNNSAVWTDAAEGSFVVKGERRIIPQLYRTVKANLTDLKSSLSAAPFEFTDRAVNSPLVIELPLPNGGTTRFNVTEYSMMEPGLSAKFPEFKTYTVKGIDDPYAFGKIDITLTGFHAMVLSPNGSYFIDPYSSEEKEIYISYFKKDFVTDQILECHVEENVTNESKEKNLMRGFFSSGPQLRSYRLALAATGEYTARFGGTVAGAMDAIVTSMNRINGVYEREMSVRMVLIANNDLIVYTNGATDPYSNNDGFAMLGQNQSNIDNVIGAANYDMGHVYSTGGGGVAYLGCICQNGVKARGVTGLPNPVGDPFYIDYVAHEMGHQYSGNHSFNSVMGGCGGGNRNAGTAWEPGSASTIMGYAGLCGSDDLQNNSDAYFHSGNFTEMVIYTQIAAGNSCPVITNTGNLPPVITVPVGGFAIPISTPFQLTGSATDETPNTLTYCWEEMDLGPAGSPNSPSGDAPIIRSLNPVVTGTRVVPRVSNLINNTSLYGELLPTYSRNLTFRLTVRDNSGGVDYDQVAFTADASSGPFLVTVPNTNVTWNTNVPQTVTWNVANTTAAPVNCANVSIKLSTDGGNTFNTTLIASTPNDGSQSVTLPSINNSTARISVESVGNIFFDISNANFTLSNQVGVQNNETGIPGDYALSQNFPNPFNPSTKINFDLPYNSNVTLKIMDISGKEIATIVKGFYSAGSYNVTFSANEYGTGLASGIYFYKVIAESDKGNFVTTKKMTLIK
ncbi:MAG: T9SS type A sorting domain-containing protein [Ignavibacteria bacterium]|nr:T9SS type A sorting domain-containing protein [Ignavibacteria bacterium]